MFGQSDKSQRKDGDAAAPSLPPVTDPLNFSSPPVFPDAPATTDAPAAVSPAPASPVAAIDSDELLHIKQEALQELTPLVGHLEQTPEEKFRTTMMMIQAADNQDLIKVAYEAAKAIPDEKSRAQALLDVVNEINYFTQQHKD